MPTVQTLKSSVRPTAIQDNTVNVNVSEEQFGAPIARGVESLANNVIKMQAEDDANAATETFNQASEDARKYLYEGDDAAFSRQGKTATGLHDTSKEFFGETYNSYSANLANDNQRKAFKAMWDRRTNTNLDNLARHESKERKAYFEQTQQASLVGAANNAYNNFDKPDEIQNSLIEAETIIRSNPMGSSEEVVLQKMKTARSEIHKSVIDRMMLDDPDGARKYYADNKKQVDGVHHKEIESSLKGNKQKKQAQENADKINMNDKLSDQEKRAAAKKEKNPEVRALTEGLVNQDIQRRKSDEAEFDKQASEFFWTGFLKDPDINAIPENLPASTKLAAIKFATNPTRKTELKRWNEINQIAINNPDEFLKMDLYKDVLNLDESDFQEFGKLQRSLQKGDTTRLTHVQSITSKATKALKNINYKVDSDNGQLFMRKFQDEVSRLESEEKRKIKPDEVDAVIDRLLIKGEIEDGTILGINFNDPDKFLFEVEEGEKFLINNVYVPDDDREKIIRAYRSRGISPTEEQITDLYNKKAKR